MLRTRPWQVLLVGSTIGLSWLLMMAVHELGHAINAWLSGGQVQRVVVHPLAISRTDVSPNPQPLFVAWGGAVWGVALPLAILVVAGGFAPRYRFLIAFFAGFCCLANGLYLGVGAIYPVGDAADLLRYGAARWQFLLFGLPISVLGLWMWNGLGFHFGLGNDSTDRRLAIGVAIAFATTAIAMTALTSR